LLILYQKAGHCNRYISCNSYLGTICVFTLPVNQYPNITPPAVSVSATYTGADAITVEQNVATPVEEAINGVSGMEYIQVTVPVLDDVN